MTALRHPSLVTVSDYLTGEEGSDVKHEYLGGVVHAMAGGSNRHSAISSNALAALAARLRGKDCRPFNSDAKVRIELPDHTRFYYPDAMVVCHRNPDTDHFQDYPVVVVEVLSESTRRIDLTEKKDAYLTIGTLKELIFIEQDEPRILAYRRKSSGGFDMEEYLGLEAVIPLPEIDAELPLAEVYDRVAF